MAAGSGGGAGGWTGRVLLTLAVSLLGAGAGGEIIVYPLDGPGLIVDEYPDEPARFGDALPLEGLRGFVTPAVPKDACSNINAPPGDDNYTGKWIVLIARYNCSFEEKIRAAQKAGFDAAIVHNVNSSDIEHMSAKNPVGIRIPSVFVGNETGYDLEINYTYQNGYYVVMNRDVPFDINTHLLMPFAVVVGLCLIIMIVFMIVKCIKDRRRARRHRLPNNALKKIPTCKYSKGDPYDTCAICLDDYLEGDKLRVLPCAHAYHCKCIDPWLTKNRRVCPVCKRRVFAAGERRATRPRRRTTDSDTDTDDSRTPLVVPEDNPPTQGGTFAPQNENPFQRAARFMARLRTHGPSAPEDEPFPAPTTDNDIQHESDYPMAVEETERFEASGEEVDETRAEIRDGKRATTVPFLSGVLNLRTNHFGRGEPDDAEPLLSAQSSLPARCDARLEHERPSRPTATASASASASSPRRPRATSESLALPAQRHSINAEPAARGEIGVAALPNPLPHADTYLV